MCKCSPECRRYEIAEIIYYDGKPTNFRSRIEIERWLVNHNVDIPEDKEVRFKIAYDNPDQKKRLVLRTGRWIKKYFSEGLSDRQVQELGDKINANFWLDKESGVKILKGEDIRDFYLNGGVHSCMTHENAQKFLDIYVDNPEVVSLATIKSGGHAGRALVWTINGVTYMDRIYSTSTLCEQALIDYRNQNCWATRDDLYNNCPRVKMKIRNGVSSYWPYFDTMYGVDNVTKTSCELFPGSGEFCAQNTDGTLDGSGTYCVNCDEYCDAEDSYNVGGEIWCTCCYEDNFMECEYCGAEMHRDESYHVNDPDSYVCNYCWDRHYRECTHCHDEIQIDNLTELHNGDLVCESCLENYSQCGECGEWFEELQDHDLCEDCFEEKYGECEVCHDFYEHTILVDGKCSDCAVQ